MKFTFRNPVILRFSNAAFEDDLTFGHWLRIVRADLERWATREWRKFFCKHSWQRIPDVELTSDPVRSNSGDYSSVVIQGNLLGIQPYIGQKWCYKCEKIQ